MSDSRHDILSSGGGYARRVAKSELSDVPTYLDLLNLTESWAYRASQFRNVRISNQIVASKLLTVVTLNLWQVSVH